MTRAASRPNLRAASLALLVTLGLPGTVAAQEALFLRIRPQPEATAPGGAGSAQAALAARDAVWERSNARARTIIESVCTGCLAPWSTPAKPVAVAALPEIPAARGLESDPPSEASEPTSDPSSRERRP